MMKLQSACLCKVTFLLLCRATSGNPIFVKRDRSSSMSGAVYSTNSKPSVPIGFANPVTVVSSATCVAMLCSFAGQLLFGRQLFKRPIFANVRSDGELFASAALTLTDAPSGDMRKGAV